MLRTTTLLLTALLLMAACGGDDDDDDSAQPCDTDEDCTAEQSCGFGACACDFSKGAECDTDADCPGDDICDYCLCYGPCENATNGECNTAADCPPMFACVFEEDQCVCRSAAAQPCDPPCASDEYCDYPDNLCGQGAAGECTARASGCPTLEQPACGCDGEVHTNGCLASETGGVDLNATGSCTVPAGRFDCNGQLCDIATQYCRVIPTQPDQAPISLCQDYAVTCDPPSCGCVADACSPGATTCDDTGDGVVVTCQ